ncbi:MAG: beta-Ala-His dipeptidase [Lachnospiraceae bacterium]|nr:beta-Ala-His dipeptidase [Lachnospiraceae bacterium]
MVWKKKNWTIRIGGSRRTAEPEEKPENNITEAVTTESGEKMTASNIAESETNTEKIDQRVSEAQEEATADVTETLPAAETAPEQAAETGQTEETETAPEQAADSAQTEAAETGQTEETETAPEQAADSAQTEAADSAQTEAADPAADPSCGDQESGGKTAGGKVSLDSLEPADVFCYFRQISAIPHGSFHTEAISDYLENFAKERGLDYIRDELGNLIITKPAAAGCEDAEPIALQGHVDMVCEKEEYVDLDMDTEPITLETDGEWLTAVGTTLGGDDGIAVAIMLALLDDQTLKAPMLECIFTVNEEVGLLGASGIDLSTLRSRKLINMDSEEEGVITASCGGGAEMVCRMSGKRKEKTGMVVRLGVGGLNGGHSGEKIGEGRGNAVLILARLLYRLSKEGKYFLYNLEGGKRDNAIPRNASAEILFKGKTKRKDILNAVKAFTTELKSEFRMTDPGIEITVDITEKGKDEVRNVFTRDDTMRFVRFLMIIPNGVIEFMPGFREIPRTSLSLGICDTTEDGLCTHSLVRSNVNSRKQMVMNRIICLAEAFEAAVEINGAYPAWELVVDSDFRWMAKETYERVTGKKAVVTMIHAGLECGILSSKVPGLECISIGPDMEDIHTTAERLNVASTGRIYQYVRALLAECADRKENVNQK